MHLANRKVVKLERQFRCDVGIGRLLLWQHDIQADTLATAIRRASVGSLHHTGTATGHDVELLFSDRRGLFCNQLAETARLFVIGGVMQSPFGCLDSLRKPGIVRICGKLLPGHRKLLLCSFPVDKARAAENNNSRFNSVILLNEFRLEQLELETDRSQLVAHHEGIVSIGKPVGIRCGLRCLFDFQRRGRILSGGWKGALRRTRVTHGHCFSRS